MTGAMHCKIVLSSSSPSASSSTDKPRNNGDYDNYENLKDYVEREAATEAVLDILLIRHLLLEREDANHRIREVSIRAVKSRGWRIENAAPLKSATAGKRLFSIPPSPPPSMRQRR